MRRAAKTDLNQQRLVDALRSLGFYWIDLSAVGKGVPDGVAMKDGFTYWIEFKDPNRTPRYTPQQKRKHAEMRAQGGVEVITVRNYLDVLRLRC